MMVIMFHREEIFRGEFHNNKYHGDQCDRGDPDCMETQSRQTVSHTRCTAEPAYIDRFLGKHARRNAARPFFNNNFQPMLFRIFFYYRIKSGIALLIKTDYKINIFFVGSCLTGFFFQLSGISMIREGSLNADPDNPSRMLPGQPMKSMR